MLLRRAMDIEVNDVIWVRAKRAAVPYLTKSSPDSSFLVTKVRQVGDNVVLYFRVPEDGNDPDATWEGTLSCVNTDMIEVDAAIWPDDRSSGKEKTV